jgi:hypothetical protein
MVKGITALIVAGIVAIVFAFFLSIVRYPPSWRQLRPGMSLAQVSATLSMSIPRAEDFSLGQEDTFVRHELRLVFDTRGRLMHAYKRIFFWPYKRRPQWIPMWPNTSAEPTAYAVPIRTVVDSLVALTVSSARLSGLWITSIR